MIVDEEAGAGKAGVAEEIPHPHVSRGVTP